MKLRYGLSLSVGLGAVICGFAKPRQYHVPGYTRVRTIAYYPQAQRDPANWYQTARCTLDLRIPDGVTNWPCVVWFHGGGLVHGPAAGTCGGFSRLCQPGSGIGGVSVLYRLLTNATPTEVVGDAAAAVAWTLRHIAEYGGDPKKVFLSGMSAGGYLTQMIGMDPKWLAPYGYKPSDLAGLMPETGQMAMHFGIREKLGDKTSTYLTKVNEWAPLSYARADGLPPMCIMCGEPSVDIFCRAEENHLLYASLRALGRRDVEFHPFWGRRHGTMGLDAAPYELDFLRRRVFEIDGSWTATSNRVLNALMSGVAAGQVLGAVSALADAAYETQFDCAGWTDSDHRELLRRDTLLPVLALMDVFTGAAAMIAIDEGTLTPADGELPSAKVVRRLEAAAKKPFGKYLFEKIFDPLGMYDTTFAPKRDQLKRLVKTSGSEGALFSTAQDLARFAQLLAHQGRWHRRTIISRPTFEKFQHRWLTPTASSPFAELRIDNCTGQGGVLLVLPGSGGDAATKQLCDNWRTACESVNLTLP